MLDISIDWSAQPLLVRITHGIAAEAFAGKERKGIHPRPAIRHAEAVFDILQAIGIKDEVTLAAGLAHDVIEDYYSLTRPGKLTYRLYKEQIDRGITPEEASAKAVTTYALAYEVTNADHMLEGKRTWQVDKARTLSPAAKMIKVADQIANIIDTVNHPPAWTLEKKLEYLHKAMDIGHACAGINPLMDALMIETYLKASHIIRGENGDHIDTKQLLEDAKQRVQQGNMMLSPALPDGIILSCITDPGIREHDKGVARLWCDEEARVVAYEMLVAPDRGKRDEANVFNIIFRQNLEHETDTETTVKTGKLIPENFHTTRVMALTKPMKMNDFLDIADKASVIDGNMLSCCRQHLARHEATKNGDSIGIDA